MNATQDSSFFHKHNQMYTRREDILSSIAHLIGFALSLTGLILMTVKASFYGTTINIIGSVIFGICLCLMYLASGFYHWARDPAIKAKLRMIDHMNIYFLIAGTYTPVALISLPSALGWFILGLLWGIALFGLAYKILSFQSSWLSTFLYVLMGWVAIFFLPPIIEALPLGCLMWIVLGGMFYTSGVIFYMMDEVLEWCHFLWHLFVMAGSASHFIAVYFYLSGVIYS
jgi:hemolysin III